MSFNHGRVFIYFDHVWFCCWKKTKGNYESHCTNWKRKLSNLSYGNPPFDFLINTWLSDSIYHHKCYLIHGKRSSITNLYLKLDNKLNWSNKKKRWEKIWINYLFHEDGVYKYDYIKKRPYVYVWPHKKCLVRFI